MKRTVMGSAISIAVVLLLASSAARAAGPTTAQCLAASDASLKFATEHKLRAERAQLIQCAASTCPAAIHKECLSHVDEVNAQIPTIIIAAANHAGENLTAVKVSMDGEPLTDRLDGTALAVDPGEHTFTFEAAGEPTLTKKLVIEQAQKDRHELVAFAVEHKEAASTPTTAATPLSRVLGTQRVVALVSGGIGVVGLGVGAVFGALAVSQKASAESLCPGSGTTCSSSAGAQKWSTASSSGTVSTVGFVVAGAGLAATALFWFTAPRPSGAATSEVGFGPGGVQVRGSW